MWTLSVVFFVAHWVACLREKRKLCYCYIELTVRYWWINGKCTVSFFPQFSILIRSSVLYSFDSWIAKLLNSLHFPVFPHFLPISFFAIQKQRRRSFQMNPFILSYFLFLSWILKTKKYILHCRLSLLLKISI